jgi:hypothetical protein
VNKRVVFICPFFKGRFVPYFQLFLNSCRRNPEFDWLIFTDNESNYSYPPNVHKIQMSFEEAKILIQSKFDFMISLSNPYKLCDYKPAYGYIFEDYIKEYDFWGHNDLDVIYGDLSKFISDNMLENYDKLFMLGHFTLYRNTYTLSRLFMEDYKGEKLYKAVFTTNRSCNFDEDWGNIRNVNDILKEKGIRIYENPNNESKIADIYDKSTYFRINEWDKNKSRSVREKIKKAVFIYDNGKLLRYEKKGNSMKTDEYMYIHLIHRNMRIEKRVEESERYAIIPDAFIPVDFEVTVDSFDEIRLREFNLNYFRLRFRNLKTKVRRCFINED